MNLPLKYHYKIGPCGFYSEYIWTEFTLSSLVKRLSSHVLDFLLRCFSPDHSRWRNLIFMEWHFSLLAVGLQSCHPVHVLWRFKTAAFKETNKGSPWFFKMFLLEDFIYLFLGRGEGRDKERESNVVVWERNSCLSHAPNWGPDPPPRHVPWLGIKAATSGFAGQHSIHWATSARVKVVPDFESSK